jgi:hypothetical protein
MSIKQKIWDKLDKDGYCTDSDLAKIYGKEPNFYTSEIYKKAWLKLKLEKEEFKDKEIVEKHHSKGKYLIRLKGMDKFSWYKVGKDFYNTINFLPF